MLNHIQSTCFEHIIPLLTDGFTFLRLEFVNKGIELILALMSKSMPQGSAVKTEEFYDARFTNELRDSGFLKKLWGDKL